MITIGNPIFDSVFKFFLADEAAAKILLSVLIKKKVTKLEPRKNEFMQKGDEGEISVLKIDFGAHILATDENGEEVDQLIIIELQKAWVNYEVPRFRRYLGSNYIAAENIFHDTKDDRDYGLPIIAVYILNHRIGALTEPVVRLNRKYYDYDDNELSVGVPDKFAESLSHDCIIVQVPLLTGKIKNRAEKILQIFNQKFTVERTGFKMQFDDTLTEGDAEMQKLVNRLSMVFTDEYTTEKMIIENEEYQVYVENQAIKTENQAIKTENQAIKTENQAIKTENQAIKTENQAIKTEIKAIKTENQAIKTENQAIKTEIKAIETENQAIKTEIIAAKAKLAEQNEAIAQKAKELSEQQKQFAASIKMLSSLGIPPEQIAEKLNISVETVKMLLE